MQWTRWAALVAAALGVSACAVADDAGAKTPGPPELGRVAWERDYAAATKQAKAAKKPLLILFDEVPG